MLLTEIPPEIFSLRQARLLDSPDAGVPYLRFATDAQVLSACLDIPFLAPQVWLFRPLSFLNPPQGHE